MLIILFILLGGRCGAHQNRIQTYRDRLSEDSKLIALEMHQLSTEGEINKTAKEVTNLHRLPQEPILGEEAEKVAEELENLDNLPEELPQDPTVVRDVNKVGKEIENLHRLPRELYGVLKSAATTFLPGFRAESVIFVKACVTLALGVIWFIVYFRFIYKSDRQDGLDHLGMASESESALSPPIGFNSDLILVFHNPGHDYSSDPTLISPREVDQVLVTGQTSICTNLAEVRKVAFEDESSTLSMMRTIERFTTPPPSAYEEVAEAAAKRATISDAREALLQDLYRLLPTWGFDVTAFTSIDSDELFVCVSLNERDAINYYLKKNNSPVQLRQEIVGRLGIRQDPNDPASSPPSIGFDPNMLRRLKEQGILKSEDETELFKDYAGSGKPSVVSTKDCIWTIYNELSSHVDLDAAVDGELLVTWYPVHNPSQVNTLKAIWANWHSMMDLSCVQPVRFLRDYFGPRLTFLFAWNGVYCKTLIPLVVVAMVQVVLVRISRDILGSDLLHSSQVLGFSLVTVVWAKISENLWSREQGFFMELWNIQPNSAIAGSVRPEFKGVPAPSPVDANIMVEQVPKQALMIKQLITAFITVFFCMVVGLCIYSWMLMFDGKMGFVSSLILSVAIKIFEVTFQHLATKMTEYEGHKYDCDYHDSLLWKLFLFSFVNNYSAFFFMTIRNAWKGCLDECLEVSRSQVTMTLIVLGICSVLQMLADRFMVQLNLWWEVRQLTKEGKEVPTRFVVEEQAKYGKCTETVEVQNMQNLVVALGYVFLFGGVSAAVVPYCLLVFAVQLRSFAITLCTCTQRPFPYQSFGIGNWQFCIHFLMCVGVMYGGFMFVVYGAAFRGSSVRAKMTGMLLYGLFVTVVWEFINLVFPADDKDRILMIQRRGYVQRRLLSRVGAKGLESSKAEALKTQNVGHREAFMKCDWSSIQSLASMPPGPLTPLQTLSS